MTKESYHKQKRATRGYFLVFLAIEFLDELVFGAREAAWPLIRDDLRLGYSEIGLLLALPGIVGSLLEPWIGVLGDVWRRPVLIIGGGVTFALALGLTGVSNGFWILMLAFILLNPASGAFVSLSQSTLMDIDPGRHEQNMARWTLAGSIGAIAGPLALGAAILLALGWRGLFLGFAVLSILIVAVAGLSRYPSNERNDEETGLWSGVKDALQFLKRPGVLRWLVLLEFSDLLLDIFLGYIALYFVDVVHASQAEGTLSVAVFTASHLVGGILIIPLLERLRGMRYLRWSVFAELVLFPAFLLAPGLLLKLGLLVLVCLASSGWYSVLKAQLYSALPGKSGTVMALSGLTSLLRYMFPYFLGLAAERVGLGATMWLLLAGPLVLLVGIVLPRESSRPGM